MHNLGTTGSLHCGILRVFSYTHSSLHCGHVQLCDMSVSNPFAIPIHNGTSRVNMVFFAEWVHVCFTDVVDVKKIG